MDLSLRKLKHLVTVAETQNFSRAAELLNLSQPALSKSISAIEESYGIRLFERSSSGVQVTPVGAHFVADARRLLNNANSFDHNFRMLAGGTRGNIALGIGPTAASLTLSQLASRILGQGSGIVLSAEIRPLGALMTNLVNEGIELLIAENAGLKISEEIECRKIGDVEGGFFVRKGHPLEKQKSLTISDIMRYPLACQEDPSWLSAYDPDKNNNVLICDSYSAMLQAMHLSDMVCIYPRQFLIHSNRRNMNELLLDDWEPRKIPIMAGWRRGRLLSPIARQVIDTCSALLAGEMEILDCLEPPARALNDRQSECPVCSVQS